MTDYTIGMWMYRNDGGEVIQQRIIEQLNQNGIAVINNLSLKNGYANNGHIFSGEVEMANLDLYFSYNASEQSDYQVYLYQALNMTVSCINSFEAFCVSEDKFKTSHLLNQNGVPTANYQLCHNQELEMAREILRNWGGRHCLNPPTAGAARVLLKLKVQPSLNDYYRY
jgi:ribosomal protein S6--L-glutamate ligase